MALGDVDGDGDVDAVVAQFDTFTSEEHILWLNNGQGQFTESPQVLGRGNGQSVAIGDLDGDGDLDIAAAASTSLAVGADILINQGGTQMGTLGVFSSSQIIESNNNAQLVLGDLDNDADLDLVIGDEIWWNDGSANFTAGPTLGYTTLYDLGLGDLDNDGDLDIVRATETSSFATSSQIFWNEWDTNQSFIPGPELTNEGINNGVGLADLDNDGAMDIYFASSNADAVWWNNGDQTFSVGLLNDTFNDTGIALGDFDGDGDSEAFVTRRAGFPSPDQVWLNDGNRSFTLNSQELAPSGSSFAAAVADLDGDLDLDVFVVASGPNLVWFNTDGAPPGTPPTPSPTPVPPQPGEFIETGQRLSWAGNHNVVLGDIDGDNDLDMVLHREKDHEIVFETRTNHGNGRFSAPQIYTHTTAFRRERDIDLADIDLDSDLDVVTAKSDAIWLNDGTGQFTPSIRFPTSTMRSFALGDVDADGDDDALVYLKDKLLDDAIVGETRLWLNQGGIQGGVTGVYTDSGQTFNPPANVFITIQSLYDVDADGDLDAMISHRDDVTGTESNAIWLNQGNAQSGTIGTFADSGQRLGSIAADFIIWGDIDGDGDVDAFVFAEDLNNILAWFWLNDGAGQFQERAFSVLRLRRDAAFGDIDGDGDLDLIIVGASANQVLQNDGSGNFTQMNQRLGLEFSKALALEDLDGDSDPDAVIVENRFTRVWLNGEVPTLPVAHMGSRLIRDSSGTGSLIFPHWKLNNARIPIQVEGLQSGLAVTLSVKVESGREWLDTLTFTQENNQQYPTAGENLVGGKLGEIWSPYNSADTGLSETVNYLIEVSSPNNKVSVADIASFQLTFHHPNISDRFCFLSGILYLHLLSVGSLPRASSDPIDLETFRAVRDEVMLTTPQGRYYNRLYSAHSPELLQITSENIWLIPNAIAVLNDWTPAIDALVLDQGDTITITQEMMDGVLALLDTYAELGSPELQTAIQTELAALDIETYVDMTMNEALATVNTRSISELYLPLVLR